MHLKKKRRGKEKVGAGLRWRKATLLAKAGEAGMEERNEGPPFYSGFSASSGRSLGYPQDVGPTRFSISFLIQKCEYLEI